MCRFFSCLVTKTADVLWEQDTDSHEDLVQQFKINDTKPIELRTFVRVEVVPPNNDYKIDISKWDVGVDEPNTIPDWWGTKHKRRQCRRPRRLLQRE